MQTVAVNVWAATLYAVVNMKNSVKIAFCGIVSAIISVIMVASLLPDVKFAVPAIAGLFLIPVFAEAGAGYAAACFTASSTVSFFISDKTSWLLFVTLFGYYPILKPFMEKIKISAIKWILKLLVFDLAAVVCYFVQTLTVGVTLKAWWLVITFVLGNITFIVYDIAVSRTANLYYLQLHKRISSILKKTNGEG